MACIWPTFGLDLTSLRIGSGIALCPRCCMFVCPVMAICVDCLLGISYATIGRENQVVFAFLL